MKTVEPSVELIHHTPNPERVIERMGRICYQSQHKVARCTAGCVDGRLACSDGRPSFEPCEKCDGTGTDITSAITFVKMILSNGHTSVLEHASAGFSIITDRGVTHEIVRHRIGVAYSQESTRFCNYALTRGSFDGDLSFIKPPGMTICQENAWLEAVHHAETIYLKLIGLDCTPQIARSVLPNSLKSEIGVTMSFQAWRHFLTLRTSPKAHPQMRQIASMLRDQLIEISPAVFEDFRESP